MPIRDHYVPAFNSIAERHGQRPATAQIGPQDSLQETIGYTREYVVEHRTPHFRYAYYRRALSLALRHLRFAPADRRILHLDIGCGPGVFSWVMYDHMATQDGRDPNHVEYYGYNHCEAMIELAHLFLEHFPDQYEFHGFCDLYEVSTTLTAENSPDRAVVVTLGYALLQVRDNPTALTDFSTLIASVFPAHSGIVVAADAHHDRATRDSFNTQCNALGTALAEVGVTLEDRVLTATRSVMYARLGME